MKIKIQTDEPIKDVQLARKTLKRHAKGNRKIKKALLEMWDDGLLNVFPDGNISLTEKARPMADELKRQAKSCLYYSGGDCLVKNLKECIGIIEICKTYKEG